MKKHLTFLMAIIIIAMVALAGCNASENNDLDKLKDFSITIANGENTFELSDSNFKDFKLEDIKVTTNKKNVKKTFEYKGIKLSSILEKSKIDLKDKEVKLEALDKYNKTLTFDDELINNTYIVLFEKIDGNFNALEKDKIKNVNIKDQFPNNWVMGLNKISVIVEDVKKVEVKDVEVNYSDIAEFSITLSDKTKEVLLNNSNINKYKFKSFDITINKKGKEIKSTFYGVSLKSILDENSLNLISETVKLEEVDKYSKEIIFTEDFINDTYIVFFEEVDGVAKALKEDEIKNVNINDKSMQNWVSGLNSIRRIIVNLSFENSVSF